jgi:hypothetical protein
MTAFSLFPDLGLLLCMPILEVFSYMATSPSRLELLPKTLTNPNYFLKELSPETVTLGIRVSTSEFGDTIRSITVYNNNTSHDHGDD